jgi:hypothetical protein
MRYSKMLKRILIVLLLSLMMNTVYATPRSDFIDALAGKSGFIEMLNAARDLSTAAGGDGNPTLEQYVQAAINGGIDMNSVAGALKSAGFDENATTFAMVSAGADADSVVAAVIAANPGTTATAQTLATTLVEAKINANLRVGITTDTTTTTARTSFTAAVSSGGGSPLSTEDFIKITSSS